MKEIIKKRNRHLPRIPDNKATYYDTCSNCGTDYTYQEEDIFVPWVGRISREYVKCPHCKEKNLAILSKKKIKS